MNQILYLLFGAVVNFALLLIYLRFMVQLAEIERGHPYVKALYRLTAVVDVFARIFPPVAKGRVSSSALFLLLLLWFIGIAGRASVTGQTLTPLELFFSGSVTALISFFTALRWTIIASILMSFVVLFSQKMHPIIDIVMQLSEPIIAPFRKISPNLGMIDLSPLLAILTLGLLGSVVGVFAQELWLYTAKLG